MAQMNNHNSNTSRDPAEDFERRLKICGEIFHRIMTLVEKRAKVSEYITNHQNRCEDIITTRREYPRLWQSKVEKARAKVLEAEKCLYDIDEKFDDILCEKLRFRDVHIRGPPYRPVVTGVLNMLRFQENRGLAEDRERAAVELEERMGKHQRRMAQCRVVDALVGLALVLVRGAQRKLLAEATVLNGQCDELQQQWESDIRREVENAARELQNTIAFHEDRKRKADSSINARSEDLREHRMYFGESTPTEAKRLEECIAELKRAKAQSDGLINKCMQLSHEFWEKWTRTAPRALAHELATIFNTGMKSSNVSHLYESLAQSQAPFDKEEDQEQQHQEEHEESVAPMAVQEEAKEAKGEMVRPAAALPIPEMKKDEKCYIM